jgi:signal transduction histidine kinase
MNSSAKVETGFDAPLPFAQFKRFVAVFHFVFVAGIVFSLVVRWRRPELVWSWRDVVLVVLALVQIGLYLRFMVMVWKPPGATGWWLAYFASGYAIWLLEWKLEGALQWTAWAYMGQMFGVLRPVFSAPIAFAIFAAWVVVKTGIPGLAQIQLMEWLGYGAVALSATVMGLFFYKLTVTSSQRARLIQTLEAAQKELEQAHQRDAELAVLRERERLARDLHDSLGHGLATLSIQLEAAQRLYGVDPTRASTLLEQMKELTRGCMEQLRRALAGLRAPGLGEQPLVPAVEKLCGELGTRAGLKVDCTLPRDTEGLPTAVAEALWRVVQEGLANVEKHAKATSARVLLALEPREASVCVTDNGGGIPGNGEGKPGHYGLRGLRERIEGLGGVFSVQTLKAAGKDAGAPGGTVLQARIPLLPK